MIGLGAKPETDLFKKEAAEDKAKFSKIDSKLSSNNIAKETTKVVDAESKAVNSTKKALNLSSSTKKVAGQKLVKNLKTAGKVGIGVAGAAGIGYGIKKAVDKNKKENGKEK